LTEHRCRNAEEARAVATGRGWLIGTHRKAIRNNHGSTTIDLCPECRGGSDG
jgi:hypothetical protein